MQASIVTPLTMFTNKDALWHCYPLQHRAFENLKSVLCTALLLIYPDLSFPNTIEFVDVVRMPYGEFLGCGEMESGRINAGELIVGGLATISPISSYGLTP